MKIAFVGCGYVFDIYMRTQWAHPELEISGIFDIDETRLNTVTQHYGLRAYASYDDLLADTAVEIVVNLTSIQSHGDVVRRALEAGKHVYSEKPLTTDLESSRALFALAEAKRLILTGAPCNLYCDAISTVWKAVRDGAIGKPVLVYAELDDNPAHLMNLEKMQSPTGAPFPYAEELQEGCTVEHAAYHLVWICAMFGPALAVTGFSKMLVEHKTATPLSPPDTPDFSVGCLHFAHGGAARITCSWVAPRDHRLRIIGDAGEICADNVFHDQAPVYLERFSRVSLSGRKVEEERGVGRSPKHKFVSWLRRREIYAQDKLLGIAEMVRAMQDGRPQPMPADFLLHLNELTLLIQRAGPGGVATEPTTSFSPLEPLRDVITGQRNYLASHRPRLTERTLAGVVDALQKK